MDLSDLAQPLLRLQWDANEKSVIKYEIEYLCKSTWNRQTFLLINLLQITIHKLLIIKKNSLTWDLYKTKSVMQANLVL